MADKKKLPKMSELETAVKPHHFPSTITLDENDFPAVKDWSVGKKYKLEIVAKQVRASQGEEFSPPGDTDADKVHIKLELVKVLEGEPYDEKEKKEEDKEEKDEKEEGEKEPPVAKAIKNKFLGYKE